MKEFFRHTAAVATFELRRMGRSRSTILGILAFAALLAIGHWSYWKALPPRPEDDRLFGYAYVAAMILCLRFGLADDRATRFDRFLGDNLISPIRLLAGKLQAVAAFLLLFGAYAFTLALAFSTGEWVYAWWYVLRFTLTAWVFLPIVVLVEVAMDMRYPVAVVLTGFMILMVAADPLVGVETVTDALGLRAKRFQFGTLTPLTGRAILATGALVLLYPLCTWRMMGWSHRPWRRD